jgi:hypothetical protein
VVEYDVRLGLNASFGFVPMQGMRIHEMASSQSLAVSAAACTGPYGGSWQMQFSLMSLDAKTGALRWAKMYPKTVLSHPYAMTLSPPKDPQPGFVIAGLSIDDAQLQPNGRLLKARASDGAVLWDRTFTDRSDVYFNIECYGVDTTLDGGYIVTCGNGPEEPPAWMDCHQKTWTAFVYRADAEGNQLWTANVTDSAEKCISDAGEYIVTARNGGYAVYVDSGTLGKPGTGGNFGLVVLRSDTATPP